MIYRAALNRNRTSGLFKLLTTGFEYICQAGILRVRRRPEG